MTNDKTKFNRTKNKSVRKFCSADNRRSCRQKIFGPVSQSWNVQRSYLSTNRHAAVCLISMVVRRDGPLPRASVARHMSRGKHFVNSPTYDVRFLRTIFFSSIQYSVVNENNERKTFFNTRFESFFICITVTRFFLSKSTNILIYFYFSQHFLF